MDSPFFRTNSPILLVAPWPDSCQPRTLAGGEGLESTDLQQPLKVSNPEIAIINRANSRQSTLMKQILLIILRRLFCSLEVVVHVSDPRHRTMGESPTSVTNESALRAIRRSWILVDEEIIW